MSTAEIDLTFLGMIFGPIGSGKTTLAMRVAQDLIGEGEKIAFVDSAEGWVSLKNAPTLMDNAFRLPYTSYNDLPALADAIAKGVKGFENIRVVVIDELDSVADDTLVTVVRERHNTPDSERLPEIEGKDYRPMGDLIAQAIARFQKAGVHLILVAHDKIRVDHRKVSITGPALSPQLKNKVAGLMHVIAYASAEVTGTAKEPQYNRTIQAQPTGLIEAKTRIGALRAGTKLTHEYFIDSIYDWVNSGDMAGDLAEPEATYDTEPDELPTDGIPAADVDEDDEPAFVESE
jgi:hypothetical protein